jgi:heat shock protein HslJ
MKNRMLVFFCLLSLTSFSQRVAPVAPLNGTYRLLKQKVNQKLIVAASSKTKISIDQSAETIHCNLGCNTISGDFSAIGNEIEPLQLITTEMYCTVALSKLERLFVKNMARVNRYKSFNRDLYLYHDKELVMVLRRK